MLVVVIPVFIQLVVLTPQINAVGVVELEPLNIRICSPLVENPGDALPTAEPFPEGVTVKVVPEELEKFSTVPAGITEDGVVQVIVDSFAANGPLADVQAFSVK